MEKLICDFCGSKDSPKNPIISGDKACICQSCVTTAHDIMHNSEKDPETKKELEITETKVTLLTPSELKALLDDYVIGQCRAKKSTFSCSIQSL